ncbi:MAG: Gfo/Idh/MocA family oxidoreductase, partial [Oricola sp.]|nr:Gfo/Idh/MocA family oxidoreductase [Oricola sp.]
MRIALVGFGVLAQRYYTPALQERKEIEVIAIADPAAAVRPHMSAAFPQARLYSSEDELLSHENVDAVLIATPPSAHLDTALAVARKSIPVFVEKPLALTHQKDVLTEDRPEWRNITVNFNRRFWPHYAQAREAVRAGRLGQITSAKLTLYSNLAAWAGQSNHRLSEREGGSIHDLGCHLFDLAAFLFGQDIAEIKAKKRDVDGWTDRVDIDLSMRMGQTVTCAFGYGPVAQDRLHISGSDGAAFFRDANCRLWCDSTGASRLLAPGRTALQWTGDFLAIAKRAADRKTSMLRWTIAAALNDFFDRVESGTDVSAGIEQARHVASVIDAVTDSLQH